MDGRPTGSHATIVIYPVVATGGRGDVLLRESRALPDARAQVPLGLSGDDDSAPGRLRAAELRCGGSGVGRARACEQTAGGRARRGDKWATARPAL